MEFFEIRKKKSLKATRPSFQKKAATTTFIREKTSTMSMPSRHEEVEEKGKEEAFARLKRLSRNSVSSILLLSPRLPGCSSSSMSISSETRVFSAATLEKVYIYF